MTRPVLVHAPAKKTYSAREFAALLGCHSNSIYRMCAKGTCPVAPIRIGRELRFPRPAVNRLLNGEAV